MTSRLRFGDPEGVGMAPYQLRRISELSKRWVGDGVTSALLLLVARRGTIVLHEARGQLRPEEDAPPLPLDAIFPMASLTKPVTATAVMCLAEEGLLGLTRPVREYIPEFVGEGKDAVLVHHLLTHTSGLREADVADARFSAASPREGLAAPVGGGQASASPPAALHQHPSISEYLQARYSAPLRTPPGTEMSYCTIGYNLLGEIVGRVSGKPLAQFAAERIFHPLGMDDTSYALPEARRHRLVGRPSDAPTRFLVAQERLETPWPSGGVFSTARDMAAFGQMFLDRGGHGAARVLSPASVAAMTRDQIPGLSATFEPEFFPEASWGWGWQIQGNRRGIRGGSLCSPAAFGHNGSGGVYLWADPTYDLVGVYLSVVSHGRPGLFANWSADLFIDAATASVTDA
jgi:CubicO group peptidase (beta-lactamase class C family)